MNRNQFVIDRIYRTRAQMQPLATLLYHAGYCTTDGLGAKDCAGLFELLQPMLSELGEIAADVQLRGQEDV